jgi:hypothetical protein
MNFRLQRGNKSAFVDSDQWGTELIIRHAQDDRGLIQMGQAGVRPSKKIPFIPLFRQKFRSSGRPAPGLPLSRIHGRI